MKTIQTLSIILLLVAGLSTQSVAQKVGHINARALLLEMPKMKSASTQLETFAKQKQSQGEAKAKELETFYTETMKLVQAGTLSPVQQQQKETELQNKQVALQKFDQESKEALMKKEEEIFAPIVDELNAAIKRVGENNGYDYILDSGVGALIHFGDADDVTALVKKELGI